MTLTAVSPMNMKPLSLRSVRSQMATLPSAGWARWYLAPQRKHQMALQLMRASQYQSEGLPHAPAAESKPCTTQLTSCGRGKLVPGRISLPQRPPLDAGTAEDGFLPTGTSPASLLIPSRRVDTVMDSMTRAPAMPSASAVWCDQTPL